VNDPVKPRELATIQGEMISVPVPEFRTHLQFRPFAGCRNGRSLSQDLRSAESKRKPFHRDALPRYPGAIGSARTRQCKAGKLTVSDSAKLRGKLKASPY
jgi:hypothetical protein